MTRRPRRSLLATVLVIASLSAVGSAGIFGALGYQMAAGRDPALGPKARALAAAQDQAPNRRIVRRTIVVRKVHDPGAAPSTASPSAPSPPPPPAAAPEPVPAPAPVVTKVS